MIPFSPRPHRTDEPSDFGPRTPGSHDDGSELKGKLAILRRYKWLVLGTTVAGIALAANNVYRQPPVYRAVASVRLSDERRSLTSGIALDEPQISDQLQSEIQILQSRRTLGIVVDELGLRLAVADPAANSVPLTNVVVDSSARDRTIEAEFGVEGLTVRDGAQSVTAGYGAPIILDGVRFAVASRPSIAATNFHVRSRDAAISELRGGLHVAPRPKTSLLDVSFTAGDPILAQRWANGV